LKTSSKQKTQAKQQSITIDPTTQQECFSVLEMAFRNRKEGRVLRFKSRWSRERSFELVLGAIRDLALILV
jgi:hypothetical protein